MSSLQLPPLSLYVHLPWCVRKCPYCDFNSHAASDVEEREGEYVAALIRDLQQQVADAQSRSLASIFFGGGTPSLFSPQSIEAILEASEQLIGIDSNCEITLEANPGTAEQARFSGYRNAGVNRLSIGAQSFDDSKLQTLGRIHQSSEIHKAIEMARQAGFENLNVDLMHGLPGQTPEQAVDDLEQAFQHGIEHLSWYELTIEPNTEYFKRPPELPDEDVLEQITLAGSEFIRSQGFARYEVSAYARSGKRSRHNLNYWTFGDYIGIGAGAHGKITYPEADRILRKQRTRQPDYYLSASPELILSNTIEQEDRGFEFLMNALRLTDGFTLDTMVERTGLQEAAAGSLLRDLIEKQMITEEGRRIFPTETGLRFLNSALTSLLGGE